jgi:hypothetical protein
MIFPNCFFYDLVNLDGAPGAFLTLIPQTPCSKNVRNHSRTDSTETFNIVAISSFDSPSDRERMANIFFTDRIFPDFSAALNLVSNAFRCDE